ncbi:MAG: YfgM family protein [Gammaproteobacteria bacterium]
MKVYATETEQVEQIKKWLQENGVTIVVSILIVIAVMFGWRYYQNHVITTRAQASSAYEEMMISIMNNQPKFATVKGEYLIREYPKTPYANLAALILAQSDVNQGHYDTALAHLQWVIEHAKDRATTAVAKVRKARILLTLNKKDEALATLDSIKDKAFTSAYYAVKGDVYFALGRIAEAKSAYEQSIKLSPKDDALKPLIQMKLSNM